MKISSVRSLLAACALLVSSSDAAPLPTPHPHHHHNMAAINNNYIHDGAHANTIPGGEIFANNFYAGAALPPYPLVGGFIPGSGSVGGPLTTLGPGPNGLLPPQAQAQAQSLQ